MEPPASFVRTFTRYLGFQIPGWIVAVLVLEWLHRAAGLSVPVAVSLFLAWLLKDLLLFPFLRRAYEPGGHTAPDRLVGNRAVAVDPFSATGYVRVRGEL